MAGAALSSDLPQQFDVAIVGGGFAGIACAIALVRRNPALNIALLDPASLLPAGVPFAGARPEHLLNVRADQMSLDGAQPLHFCEFLIKRDLAKYDDASNAAVRESFAPRAHYCNYLREVFQLARRDAVAGLGQINSIRARVTQITRIDQHYLLSGKVYDADGSKNHSEVLQLCSPQVILALGAGEYKSMITHPRWHVGPWRLHALPEHSAGETALIIGSGLTGIDTAQTLHRLGWCGAIKMLSPNARLPAANLVRALPIWQLAPNFVQRSHTPRLFLQALRAELVRAKAESIDWRAVLNALRAITTEIFVSWTPPQRVSLLRRAGSLWGAHRHRMPPSVATLISALELSGQLSRVQGRFVDVQARSDNALRVKIAARTHSESYADYALVIDARGPNYRAQDWPLVTSLIDAGLLKASLTGFGLQVDRDGCVAEKIFTLGVLTYGERLETMAVPEIRQQAERIAELIVGRIGF